MTIDGGRSAAKQADLAAIGECLRSKRTELGLTLSEVESAIKVQVRYLEALEDAQVSVLPGPVYAAGFVRSYAAHLGLDGSAMAAQFRAAMERPPAREPGLRRERETGAAATPARPGSHPPETPMPARPLSRRKTQRPVRATARRAPATRGAPRPTGWRSWLVLLLALALVAGGYVIYVALRSAEPPPDGGALDPPPEPPDPAPPEPDPPADEPVFGAERVTTATGPAGELLITVDWERIDVELICGARVWIRALADGALVLEGTEPAGSVVRLEAAALLEIRLGRGLPTVIRILDVELGPAGDRDDPRTIIVRLAD